MIDRKKFIKSLAVAGSGLPFVGAGLLGPIGSEKASARAVTSVKHEKQAGREPQYRIGIIGLDTSHSPVFTRLIHAGFEAHPELSGFRVTAAYPYGSRTIESSYNMIPQYREEVQEMGVEIVGSIKELLEQVDMVLLETNDGHPRLEQALQVIESGKPMFIDKPVAASLKDTITILEAAEEAGAPVFSSSSLRYVSAVQAVRHDQMIGQVLGADTYSPATIEETHPDLFWYGIHGVEMLFTAMGTGCKRVTRTKTETTDIVVGEWDQNRLGTFRGLRAGSQDFGGKAFGSDGIADLGTFEGYDLLVVHILEFFRTGIPAVSMDETLEIYAFMEAADESLRRGGEPVSLASVMERARG